MTQEARDNYARKGIAPATKSDLPRLRRNARRYQEAGQPVPEWLAKQIAKLTEKK